MMKRIGICNDIEENYPQEYVEVCDLFQRHPNATEHTADMTSVELRLSSFGNLEFWINYSNRPSSAISYNKCVTMKDNGNYLNSAMRVAINDQIQNFRNTAVMTCEFCQSTTNPQIDHITHFAKLVTDFQNQTCLQPPSMFDDNDRNQRCFKPADNRYEQDWVNYHHENATLRVLCKRCNTTRANYNA
jgi:hypothetical protein